jgi:BioD-like phosphotransacetylase family protein
MDELLDMIVSDESPSQITDKIKDILFAKSAEKIDSIRPVVANSIFDEVSDEEE